MNEIQFRALTAADGPQVAGFVRRHWRTDKIVAHGVVFTPAELPGFGVFEGGSLVALLNYDVRGDECEVVTLASDRPGRGFGTRLLDTAVETARARKLRRVWLITTNDNTGALRFYQKRGFELVAVHRRAIERSRVLKPEIPLTGNDGIPIRDEIELEIVL